MKIPPRIKSFIKKKGLTKLRPSSEINEDKEYESQDIKIVIRKSGVITLFVRNKASKKILVATLLSNDIAIAQRDILKSKYKQLRNRAL